jgi:hypothetical protein
MVIAKTLLLTPVLLAGLVVPSGAAPMQPAQPGNECMAPHTFLTALSSAGDWIVKRDPVNAGDEKVTGVVFREAGMIDVAVFENGCLAMVVVVGKAPPDIKV